MRKKIIITVVVLLLLCFSFFEYNTYSRYKSEKQGVISTSVAVALLKNTTETLTIPLDQMYPGCEKNYEFSVTNYDGEQIAETKMEYTISINRSSNIPIKIYIYKDNMNITSTLINNTTNKYMFGFTNYEKHDYKIRLIWDIEDNDSEYSSLMDFIDISVNGRQVIS